MFSFSSQYFIIIYMGLAVVLNVFVAQEREMYDYFLEDVERLEPLVDITQL